MAKNIGLLGNFSGKVGNVVGYQLKNSNNKVTMATRAYVADVANPQTELQAIQRMKMAPALNFYRMLARILNNAWQGQKYGTKSRQYFMSLAMKQVTGIPFIVKGDKSFVPGSYPVSEGSITEQPVSIFNNKIQTYLRAVLEGTWGEVSQYLINSNFGLLDGDKLTLIEVDVNATGAYVPRFTYVILDIASETAAADVLEASNLTATLNTGVLQLSITNPSANTVAAGALIVSRLSFEGTTPKWLRSSATMAVSNSIMSTLMGANAYNAALQSYMSSGEVSSDWYLNQGLSGNAATGSTSGGNSSNLSVVSTENINFTINAIQETVAIATMSDGSKRAYRTGTNPAYIAYKSGSSFEYVARTQATSGTLAVIAETDNSVTGWITAVDATESDVNPTRP